MSVDAYLDRIYNPKTYNCAHFVAEVWKKETGIDISTYLHGFCIGKVERKVERKDLLTFRRIPKPISPCIVLMNPIGSRTPHVGVFIRGRLLHLTNIGVWYQRLEQACIGFAFVRFYQC